MTIKSQVIVHTINGTHKVVEVLQRDIGGKPLLASVRDARMLVSVVAKREPDGSWEPQHGIKEGIEVPLPLCFSLNRDTLEALEVTT